MSDVKDETWYETSKAPHAIWVIGQWRDEITGAPERAASYLTNDGKWWRAKDSDPFVPTIECMGTDRPDKWRPC